MAAENDMLDQSQAIAQRLYNDPTIPTISLDLHTACAIGDYQVVNKCVVSKEDLNKRNKGGWTPLMYAAYVGRDTIVGLLLDGGANTNCASTKNLSPLMVSAGSGIESVCYFLLQHGANIDATDIDGCTALLHATRQGQQRTVSLLLDHGANCEIGDNEQITPLMQAAMDGHEIIVELLIGYGAEIHKKTSNGMTAQNLAMRNRHMVIVSMLDNARFRQTFGGASFESSSSSGGSDELMSGPDAVAKMSNFGVSGSFSSDYYKYMESKKNRHSFSAIQTGPRRRLVRSSFSAPEQENPPYYESPNVMEKLEEEEDPEKTMEAPPPSMQQQRSNQSDQLPSMEEFLSYMGLDKLIPILQEQEVDLPTLMTLNEEDLKRVGVKLFGPRRRLIQAIEQITGKASSATAPPATTTTTTVNKQASSPSGTTNESSKIDTEQEEHERHQLEEMLEKERKIRTTTEQFALQLQLSRQQANECATTLQQTISDQVIHLTSARKIFTKLSTSLSELNTIITDLKQQEEVTNSKQLQEQCTEAMKLHTVLGSEMGAVSKAAETMRHKSDELCYHLLSSLQNSQQKQV